MKMRKRVATVWTWSGEFFDLALLRERGGGEDSVLLSQREERQEENAWIALLTGTKQGRICCASKITKQAGDRRVAVIAVAQSIVPKPGWGLQG